VVGDAHDLGPEDLVLSHFSLAREHPIEHRVTLAAAAGFAGIGLYVGQYRELEASGFAPTGLAELLDEHGVLLAEIEVVPGLGADGEGGERAASMERTAWRMADTFNCRYLQVIGPAGRPIAEAAAAFGALCDRAADHDLVVGLEFLPFTDIYGIAEAQPIVEEAGRPNGGLCVDIWHHERGASDLDAIRALPAEMIKGIQVNDGPKLPEDPDYYTDCLTNRVPPGAGEFDMAGFVDAIRSTGATLPWSVEVCSASGWAQPALHVERCAAGMRACLN
jgi:sugar phosphate isomerase/epimerase